MKTNAPNHADSTNTVQGAGSQSHIAEKVGREILESRLDPAAWATALSESNGNRQQAFSHYARMRIRTLERQHSIQVAKTDSLELRRLKQCLGGRAVQPSIARSVREMLNSPRLGKPLNFAKPSLSPMWLAILCVGSTGTAATLGHLSAVRLSEGITNHLTIISTFCGLAVVGGALVLRRALPKPWIMQCWTSGLVTACNLVCLSSLFLGTKIIKRALATDSAVFPIHQAAATPARADNPKADPLQDQYLVSTNLVNPASLEKN